MKRQKFLQCLENPDVTILLNGNFINSAAGNNPSDGCRQQNNHNDAHRENI